jgi:hypothetical protein
MVVAVGLCWFNSRWGSGSYKREEADRRRLTTCSCVVDDAVCELLVVAASRRAAPKGVEKRAKLVNLMASKVVSDEVEIEQAG